MLLASIQSDPEHTSGLYFKSHLLETDLQEYKFIAEVGIFRKNTLLFVRCFVEIWKPKQEK